MSRVPPDQPSILVQPTGTASYPVKVEAPLQVENIAGSFESASESTPAPARADFLLKSWSDPSRPPGKGPIRCR